MISLHVIIPAYKRPDFLEKTLRSLFDDGPKHCRVSVFDDCTPDNSLQPVVEKFKEVRFVRFERNVGSAKCLALGLSDSLCIEKKAVRFLVASDHFLPRGWSAAVVRAAHVAYRRRAELGAFDHCPGPLWKQKEMHRRGESIPGTKARIFFDHRVLSTCSLPAILVGYDGARGLMNALLVNSISSNESDNLRDVFLAYWNQRRAQMKVPTFAVTGLMLQHMGHSTNPYFNDSEEHWAYYREQGRTKFVKGRNPAKP